MCIRDRLLAYADDIGMTLTKGPADAKILEPIFHEYGKVSGLHLNIGKTFWIPLSNITLERARNMLYSYAPSWGSITVAYAAKYLGFMLGPGKGTLTWTTPLRKMEDRARFWRSTGCGMLNTLLAYRVYIFPLIGFLLQLETLPQEWKGIEKKICNILFPGPTGWSSPESLQSLKHMGFPHE